MRVLVTGAAGFLGAAIAERLGARGDIELATSVRRSTPLAPTAHGLDLREPTEVRALVDAVRPDVVVHAAGRAQGSAACLDADNVATTRNLAEAMGSAGGTGGLILLGSAAQYGHSATRRPWRESDPCAPRDAYGVSKLAAETAAFKIAGRTGLRVAALRIFNVVSARPRGDQVFPSFLRRAAVGGSIAMGPLGAVRDFVEVADVLTAIERVIDRGAWSEAINVCTGVGRPTRELVSATAAAIDGLELVEAEAPPAALDWSVGDPSRCAARLGFTPSADLTGLVRDAAAWVKGEADARSGA
ncbi:MAG TPA: NAD(P)-dependent oxidoreductase [Caulobacteraceae bacterium]|jgi:nucleoside-diphosphate-sugar epimerase